MAFERNGNKINLKQGSPNSMKYETSFNIGNVTSDILITVEYEKVKEIHFNAYMWTQTAYAKDRIKIHGGVNPTESNSNMTTTGHSFTWEWDGVSEQGKVRTVRETVKLHRTHGNRTSWKSTMKR